MESNCLGGPVGGRVVDAFVGERSEWRSLGGIARKSGLTMREVADFIEANGDCFVQSSVKPGGMALYGLRGDLREVALAAMHGRHADQAAG